MDCLRFTPYVEECTEFIASACEHGTDPNLSCLMKLQSLVEKQRLSGLWESLDDHQLDTCRAPVPMLVRSCQIELQAFKNSLSNDQLFNREFEATHATTTSRIETNESSSFIRHELLLCRNSSVRSLFQNVSHHNC
jgi:hypothetical protein